MTYTIKPYDDATLASMTVDGYTIDFKPNTFVYNLSIDEDGIVHMPLFAAAFMDSFEGKPSYLK